MLLLTLTLQIELDNLRLRLELEEPRNTTSTTQELPLTLDLWKGFSKEFVLNLETIKDAPELEAGHEGPFYWFPHEIQHDGGNIHLARSFSHGLLVIKDANGQTVPFDHTADNDTWDMGVWVDEYPSTFMHQKASARFTRPTASLLRQFRKRLQPGTEYSLQMGAKSTKMSWAEEDWTCDADLSYWQNARVPSNIYRVFRFLFNFRSELGMKCPGSVYQFLQPLPYIRCLVAPALRSPWK